MAFAQRDSGRLLTRRSAFAVALLAATLSLAAPAATQRPAVQSSGPRGSRLIAPDDWMTDAISRLRGRGYLAVLSPLTQPWERNEVARALERISPASLDTMPRHVAQWIRLLRSELGPELVRLKGGDSLAVGFVAWGGGVVATSPRIDPLFPLRDGIAPPNGQPRNRRGVWPAGGAGAWAERGPFTVDLRMGTNLVLRRADPDGNFPKRIFDVLPDNEVSYVSGRFADGGFVVGRLRRNWAPVGSKGLMVSDAAIGIPQLGYDLGGRNLVLRGFIAELDTLYGHERYFVAHRIEYVRDDFAISIGESKLYGSKSGPLLSSLNPIEVFFITGATVGREDPTNTALDGQFWLRRGRLALSGETFVDDVAVDRDGAPARVAVSASVRYMGPKEWLELGADYRAVLSYTYWTVGDGVKNPDRYTFYGRGLGDNASDYDRVTLHANVYPGVPGLRLTPTVAHQRKGEWDFRQPGNPAWLQKRAFLQGVAESMTRLAIAGRYQPTRRGFAEWDAGVNRVSNADHVAGRRLSEFSAMLRIGVTWSAPDRRVP